MDFSAAIISDRLQALTRAIDLGSPAAGVLRLYTGPRPSPGINITTETLLAELTFPLPSLDNVTASTLTLRNPVGSIVLVTGDVAWARIVNGLSQWCGDLSVSLPGGVGEVQVDNGDGSLTLYAGGNISTDLAVLIET